MKKIFKQLLATAISVTMLLGVAIGVSAADSYSVNVQDGTVAIMQGDKALISYSIKTSDISISTQSDGKMILSFKDNTDKKRNISLGSQKELAVSGAIDSLTLEKSLSSSSKINITTGSTISKMTVHSASTVVAANDAKISKLSSSNKSATLQNASGKKLTATVTTAPVVQSVKKPTTPAKQPTTSASASGIKLTVKPLNASKGDTMSYLIDQLNENVIARDGNTDYVDGECKWNSSVDREITGDATVPFTFYPSTNDYEPVGGTVKIYADGNSETITITFKNGQTYYVGNGMRLSDLTKQVKNDIYVENDNGDSVKYNFKWNASSSTKFDGRENGHAYTFTITPTTSRYQKAEATIYVESKMTE